MKLKIIFFILFLSLFASCRIDKRDIYQSVHDMTINDYFFKEIISSRGEFKSDTIIFENFRENWGAKLKTNKKEENISHLKNKLYTYFKELNDVTKLDFNSLVIKRNSFYFNGYNGEYSYVVIISDNFENLRLKEYSNYKYFKKYDDSLFDIDSKFIVKVNDSTFLKYKKGYK